MTEVRNVDEKWIADWLSRTGDQIIIQSHGRVERRAALLRRIAELLTVGAHDLLAGHLGVGVAAADGDKISIHVGDRLHKEFSAGELRDELRIALLSSVEMMFEERAYRDHVLARRDLHELPPFDIDDAEDLALA